MISLVLISAVFAVLHGCASSSPETAVREFLEAALKGNLKRMAHLTVEGKLEDYRGGERFLGNWNAQYRVNRLTLEKNRSVAMVELSVGDKQVEIPYVCLKKEGKWKVSLAETMKAWEEGV